MKRKLTNHIESSILEPKKPPTAVSLKIKNKTANIIMFARFFKIVNGIL